VSQRRVEDAAFAVGLAQATGKSHRCDPERRFQIELADIEVREDPQLLA
jgi:hypothetical protein